MLEMMLEDGEVESHYADNAKVTVDTSSTSFQYL